MSPLRPPSPRAPLLRPYSLRRRLMTGMGIGFALLLSVIGLGVWGYARDAANQTYDLLLSGAALAILERSFVGPAGPSVDIPYSALEILGLAPDDRVFYRVFTPAGTAGPARTLTGDPALPLPPGFAPSSTPRTFDAAHSGETVRFVVQGRLLTTAEQSVWVVVQLGHTRLARDARELELFGNGLAALALVTAVGLVFVLLGINRALRPLAGIERDLRARDPTDLTPLVASPPREVESLVGSINGFIQRLKASQDNAQSFIADVAHQTRTSLSALQGQLDLAARQSDPAAQRDRLARAEAQARRTIRLTNQLLAHAMVIHRADKQRLESLALLPLLRGVLEEAVRQAITRDIDFALKAEGVGAGTDRIAGDPVALREALRNLIDNAVKHGPAHNRIDVCLERRDREQRRARLVLAVEDAGPGIPAARHAEAFERFQSFGPNGPSSGLGLAIVRAVADSHGAALRLGVSAYGGLRVEMAFAAEDPCG